VRGFELLGRVVSIERGKRCIDPRLTIARRMVAWAFRHSDLATRIVLRVAREWGVGSRE
jgi:hypothetical protein